MESINQGIAYPVIFFDPDNHHQQSELDPSILFIRPPQCLHNSVSNNSEFMQVIHLCCSDPSARIAEVRQRSEKSIINICKQHSGTETNPLFDQNVHDDILLDADSDYEFRSRLLRMAENWRHGLKAEFLRDAQHCKGLKEGCFSAPKTSVEVNGSYNHTINTDTQGEETDDIVL